MLCIGDLKFCLYCHCALLLHMWNFSENSEDDDDDLETCSECKKFEVGRLPSSVHLNTHIHPAFWSAVRAK